MNIDFTFYARPRGDKSIVPFTGFSDDLSDKVDKILANGFAFECEVLTTGDLSATITGVNIDIAIVIVPSLDPNEEVHQAHERAVAAVSKMITDFSIERALEIDAAAE